MIRRMLSSPASGGGGTLSGRFRARHSCPGLPRRVGTVACPNAPSECAASPARPPATRAEGRGGRQQGAKSCARFPQAVRSLDPMLFNSLTFVVFFAIVLALHARPLPWKVKKTNLLI